jgi:transposase
LVHPEVSSGITRDRRFACTQVCIAILVTREGFPLTYEVFAGTRNDVITLDEVFAGMQWKPRRLRWV